MPIPPTQRLDLGAWLADLRRLGGQARTLAERPDAVKPFMNLADLQMLEEAAKRLIVSLNKGLLYGMPRQHGAGEPTTPDIPGAEPPGDEEASPREAPGHQGIIGANDAMRRVHELIDKAAACSLPVLIQGESGTGKELVARAIHANSSRSERSFVTVNSGNLPPDLLESTLFGHVKGAFTGAVYPKKGLFDLADKGSIFFDEIGNVPLETQAKLLRVIQERDFMRLGGMETIKVDVRIIAATNVDLRQMMEEGRFREDLFYRLHVISIQLPPLRDRKDDIPLLVHHFLQKYGDENRKLDLELTPEALDLLTEYDWPGNVRELENVIERAVVLTVGPRIGVELIPDHVRKAPNFQMPQFVVPPEGISFKDVITDFEKRLIESTLEAAGGVQKRAAELLHIKPTTLNEMIKRYEIRPRRKRNAPPNGNGNGPGPESPETAGVAAGRDVGTGANRDAE